MRDNSKLLSLLVVPLGMVALFAFAESHPGYFTSSFYLGAFLGLQVLLVVVWHYEIIFFPAMMLTFLWAGIDAPLSSVGTGGRWVLLMLGALVGVVKWARHTHRRSMTALHLTAGLCVLAAVVSSQASVRMQVSLLKSASLGLLFVYGAAGARIAVLDREAAFFRGLLRACEGVAWISAFCYFGVHYEIFGNPNSLGAVLAVVIIPVLLWGVLSAKERPVRHRLTAALAVTTVLLLHSVARASILASVVVFTLMCLCLRKGKLLVQGAFVSVLLLATLAVVQPVQFEDLLTSFTQDLVYKGKQADGLLGSRKSPWEDTQRVIRESPWFGSGFGTDRLTGPDVAPDSWIASSSATSGEHGSSYLTLVQYVGLLGIVPFVALFGLVLIYIRRVCAYMWRTGDAGDYAIPLAFICVAGLINAAFEDWMVAVGYYLNVFFWTSVFLLADFQRPLPAKQAAPARALPSRFAPAGR